MSNLSNAPLAEHGECIINVHVTRAAHGGWDVIATIGAYVLARRHCDDWHRAERACLRMKAEAEGGGCTPIQPTPHRRTPRTHARPGHDHDDSDPPIP